MAGSRARRYARAIYDLAREQDQVDEWARWLAAIREVVTDAGARAVLANPSIAAQRRQQAAVALLGDRVGPHGVNLARLLVTAMRLDELDAIIEEYGRLADQGAGRIRATATTAVPLDQTDADRIKNDLSRKFGGDVRLELRVDPAIIGGLVLQIGDRVVDASVQSRLRQLRHQLAGARN
jgi:F-type H+-transporting ATPase subunit delta